jgi:hypothetical protein
MNYRKWQPARGSVLTTFCAVLKLSPGSLRASTCCAHACAGPPRVSSRSAPGSSKLPWGADSEMSRTSITLFVRSSGRARARTAGPDPAPTPQDCHPDRSGAEGSALKVRVDPRRINELQISRTFVFSGCRNAASMTAVKIQSIHKAQLNTEVSSRPESALADGVEGSAVASNRLDAAIFIVPGAASTPCPTALKIAALKGTGFSPYIHPNNHDRALASRDVLIA